MWRTCLLVLFAVGSLGADCGGYYPGNSGQRGAEGRYSFTVGLTQAGTPLAAGGATIAMEVTPILDPPEGCGAPKAHDPRPYTHVISSDPKVLVITPGNGSFTLTTGVEGDVEVRLVDDAGGIADRLPIAVRATKVIQILDPGSDALLAGSTIDNCAETLAADGTPTVGHGRLQFSATGALAVLADDDKTGASCGQEDEHVWIQGGLPGAGRLNAAAPSGAMASRDYTVVPITDVALVQLSAAGGYADRGDWNTSADARALLSGGRPLLGPRCIWSTSSPSVTVDADPPRNSDPVSTRSTVHIAAPGTFTITCTMGSAHADAKVTRPK